MRLSLSRISLILIILLLGGLTVQFFPSPNKFGFEMELENNNNNDVILITVDTLRNDYIDCEESFEETPNICGLRDNSTSFSNSYSHASYTLAGMSSVMTGRYPWEIDMLDKRNSEIPKNVSTLAEVLEKKGYKTYASYEIGAVGPEYGFDRGFDNYTTNDLMKGGISNDMIDPSYLESARNDDGPSFVYYHLFGPHQPFRASEACNNFSSKMKKTPWKGAYEVKHEYRDKFPKETAEKCYREAVRLSDKRVGDIIERLKENNQYKDSLIIFTADHGEGLWDRENFAHSHTVYDRLIDIPLFIKLPEETDSFRSDKIDEGYARHVDIYPTVLDYLDIENEFSDRPGRSLLPVIRGVEALDSDSVSSTAVSSRGMIINGFKKIENIKMNNLHVEDQYEYFDLTGKRNGIQKNDIPDQYLERFNSTIPDIEVVNESQKEVHNDRLETRLEDLGYIS